MCEVVHKHLVVFGFVRGYKNWTLHGEFTPHRTSSTSIPTYPYHNSYHQSFREDDMEGMLRDAFNMHNEHQQFREAECGIGVNDFTEIGVSGFNEEQMVKQQSFTSCLMK
ncbi:hypothetical protein GQ457_02G036280 [Hibiscus cannabinus]